MNTTKQQPKEWRFEDIAEGHETEPITFHFSEKDNDIFSNLSGNYNLLHTDDTFAREKGYKERILYGMLLASKFSYLVGMIIPGRDCLCLSQEIRFHKPLYAGEACTLKGTVISKSESTKLLEIKTEIFNSDGVLAVGGTAQVKMI